MKFILFVVALSALGGVLASSHSEAPGTSQLKADISDLYAFQSADPKATDMTTFVVNTAPLSAPFGGPNYGGLSADHIYSLHIDNDGDAQEDITIQLLAGNEFTGPVGNFEVQGEPWSLECCRADNPEHETCTGKTVQAKLPKTLTIGDKQVNPALKIVGKITEDDDSALWYQKYYQMFVVNGGRGNEEAKQSLTNANNGGSKKFYSPVDYAGTNTFPNGYNKYARKFVYDNVTLPGCSRPGRVFVGQRKDSFAIDLGRVFDLVNMVPLEPTPEVLGGAGVANCPEHNTLKDYAVQSWVLELPTECVRQSEEQPIIGVHATVHEVYHEQLPAFDADGTAELDNHRIGALVSRLGNPLINELVIGLVDKDKFSSSLPSDDAQFIDYVTHPTLPAIIEILFGAAGVTAPTNIPRNDLVETFLKGVMGVNQPPNVVASEQLRLNTAIAPVERDAQKNMGVIDGDLAGFPNGRRLGDDVVDIALRVMLGKLCHLNGDANAFGFDCDSSHAPAGELLYSDGAPNRPTDFNSRFPYLRKSKAGSKADATPTACRNQ